MNENNVLPRPKPGVKPSERRFVGRTVADVHGRRAAVPLAQPVAELVQLAQWLTPAFYIDFGRPCNSACLYCAVPPHEDAQGFTPIGDVPAIIEAGVQCGCDRAILIGGEPTIYPHLPEVFDFLRQANLPPRHIIMTNGLRLHDARNVAQLVQGGVGTVHISIDTADAGTYDRLSRSTGKLPQQQRGLDNVLQNDQLHTYIYTATTAINGPTLPGLLRDVRDRCDRLQVAAPPVIFAVVKPIGDGLRHADDLLIEPQQSAELIAQLCEMGQQLGVPVGYRNVQACLLPDLVSRNVDYYLDDFSVEVASGKRVAYSHNEYWFKAPDCARCGHQDLCTGIYRDLESRYGVGCYKPISRQGLL